MPTTSMFAKSFLILALTSPFFAPFLGAQAIVPRLSDPIPPLTISAKRDSRVGYIDITVRDHGLYSCHATMIGHTSQSHDTITVAFPPNSIASGPLYEGEDCFEIYDLHFISFFRLSHGTRTLLIITPKQTVVLHLHVPLWPWKSVSFITPS